MSIHKTARGTFQVRYREASRGNSAARSRTFKTKKGAEGFEVMQKASKLGGAPMLRRPRPTQTLGAFSREYRMTYAEAELAPTTLDTQKSVWNKWIEPRLAKLALSAITSERVQHFKADLIAEGIGDAALCKTLATLSAIMGKAVEWDRIERNPVASVRKPSQRRKTIIEALSPADIEAIRAEMPTEADGRLVSLMAYAGLRPGEALALTGADVGSQTLLVTKAVALGKIKTTKTGRDRSVPLLQPLADDLADCGPGLVFPYRDGGPWTDNRFRYWRRHVWQPAVARAGLGKLTEGDSKMGHTFDGPTPYALRHSFASLMLAEQRSRYEVAEMMGHSPSILDRVYSHVIGELRGRPAVSAEAEIAAARKEQRANTVPTLRLVS